MSPIGKSTLLSIVLLFPTFISALPSPALVCPGANNQQYTPQGSSLTYTVQCGIDRPGLDLPNMPLWVPTIEACANACSSNSACAASVFVPPNSGNGPCYLKQTLPLPVYDAAHVSLVLLQGKFPEASCPAVNGFLLVPSEDATYTITCPPNYNFVDADPYHNYATISADLPSCLKDCEKYAEHHAKCRFVTFTPGHGTVPGQVVPLPGGACHFHTTITPGTPEHAGSIGAKRNGLCPDRNGQYFGFSNGKLFELECYKDRVGGDMPNVPSEWTNTGYDCMNRCSQITGCRGVAWHWGTPQGRCHFKRDIYVAVEDGEVWGARWINFWDYQE